MATSCFSEPNNGVNECLRQVAVANAALFLVSDEARTITGQSVNVNAGGVMLG